MFVLLYARLCFTNSVRAPESDVLISSLKLKDAQKCPQQLASALLIWETSASSDTVCLRPFDFFSTFLLVLYMNKIAWGLFIILIHQLSS